MQDLSCLFCMCTINCEKPFLLYSIILYTYSRTYIYTCAIHIYIYTHTTLQKGLSIRFITSTFIQSSRHKKKRLSSQQLYMQTVAPGMAEKSNECWKPSCRRFFEKSRDQPRRKESKQHVKWASRDGWFEFWVILSNWSNLDNLDIGNHKSRQRSSLNYFGEGRGPHRILEENLWPRSCMSLGTTYRRSGLRKRSHRTYGRHGRHGGMSWIWHCCWH